MKRVAVVILNWNGRALLETYLPSVVASVPEYAEVILADNASSDTSLEYVRSEFPQLKIIQNAENWGFAKGYNEALKSVNHEYVVLLNSDIETPKGWIEPVIDFMDQTPRVGAVMPKILQYNQKDHFEYAGAAGGYIDKYGYPFCRGRIFNELEEDQNQYNETVEVFWATGACMFVKKEVYDQLEGLDDSFFAHMEEIDLCWRIKRAGYDNYCVGESKVYHLGGGTLKKLSPRKTFLNFRNGLLMLVKNQPKGQLFFTLFMRMILDGIAGLKFLLEGNPSHFLAVLKAHFAFYKLFPKFLKTRKALNQRLSNSSVTLIYPKSIIYQHFINKVKKFNKLP